MTRNLCAHPAQPLNPTISKFAIPPIWLSSHSITQRYCYPCITFSLHNFKLLPICQLEFLGLVIPCVFLLRFLRNYVSIIVNIISNNTVLQCYLLWIFVSIRRLLQLIVCIGVSPSHLPSQKHHLFFFAKPSHKSANYPDQPSQAIHPQKSDFLVISYNIKFFILNPNPIF